MKRENKNFRLKKSGDILTVLGYVIGLMMITLLLFPDTFSSIKPEREGWNLFFAQWISLINNSTDNFLTDIVHYMLQFLFG